MAYEMVMPYHLHMPSYFLETFTEYPWLFILLWIYVNVYVGKCIHTCPTGIFMPFETPLFIEPALSISPLFSERVVLCALRPQKHGLQ